MTHLIGLSGSLRKSSYNTGLLRAAADLMPDGATVETAGIHGIPVYDADEEAAGRNATVEALKDRIADADGLILVTPEYNNAMPGALKNAIDWLSSPGADCERVFGNKPVALMGASSGPHGTNLAQAAWLPIFRALGVHYWPGGQILVGGAGGKFDGDGNLTDNEVREEIETFLAGFVAFMEGR